MGRIGKERNNCRDFIIGSLDQILTKVIPHFDNYPLKTQKYADYLLFREAVMMMQCKEHLTVEGLQKIINISKDIFFLTKKTLYYSNIFHTKNVGWNH